MKTTIFLPERGRRNPPLPFTPPITGPTDSAVTKVLAYDVESNDEIVHRLQPSPPSRTVYTWDDDDIVDERELSDEEFAEATAAYELASAEWRRTGGMFVIAGQTAYRVEVQCADGTKATGMGAAVGDETRWCWTEWSTPVGAAGPPRMRSIANSTSEVASPTTPSRSRKDT